MGHLRSSAAQRGGARGGTVRLSVTESGRAWNGIRRQVRRATERNAIGRCDSTSLEQHAASVQPVAMTTDAALTPLTAGHRRYAFPDAGAGR